MPECVFTLKTKNSDLTSSESIFYCLLILPLFSQNIFENTPSVFLVWTRQIHLHNRSKGSLSTLPYSTWSCFNFSKLTSFKTESYSKPYIYIFLDSYNSLFLLEGCQKCVYINVQPLPYLRMGKSGLWWNRWIKVRSLSCLCHCQFLSWYSSFGLQLGWMEFWPLILCCKYIKSTQFVILIFFLAKKMITGDINYLCYLSKQNKFLDKERESLNGEGKQQSKKVIVKLHIPSSMHFLVCIKKGIITMCKVWKLSYFPIFCYKSIHTMQFVCEGWSTVPDGWSFILWSLRENKVSIIFLENMSFEDILFYLPYFF